jgi:PAS domain S-box-containing protein
MNKAPNVLLVEDEAIIALDIQKQLTKSGFVVTGTARTAADAFRKIEEQPPDLVLMDISIQGALDGIDAAQIVRERYEVPVIYLTAHADEATLQRAQETEPFGYIVKPLGNTNLKAIVTMSIHKHRVERQAESHRKMLSAILQGLPDAIVVADVSGTVLFLNSSAERLTGWMHSDAAGKSLAEVAPLEDSEGNRVTAHLLRQAVSQAGVCAVPRDSVLVTRSQCPTDVTGQFAVTPVGQRAGGVFLTLHDVTVQKREEQQLAQERHLFVAGELAQGVAREFYGLFDLVDECAARLVGPDRQADLDLVRRASMAGKDMSMQLLDFRESHGPASALHVGDFLFESEPLLKGFGGSDMDVVVNAEPDTGYVLSTGSHFEQLLMHLVFDAKHRIQGRGTITITADVQIQPFRGSRNRAYVRLAVCSEPLLEQDTQTPCEEPFPFNFNPLRVDLSIVNAIAVASQGFTRESELPDCGSMFEVFLPRHESRNSAAASAQIPHQVILAIGMSKELIARTQTAAGEHALVLDSSTLGEASLVAELYPGEIDLIVLYDSDGSPRATGRAMDRIRARRTNTPFLKFASTDAQALEPEHIERQVRDFFKTHAAGALVANAGI